MGMGEKKGEERKQLNTHPQDRKQQPEHNQFPNQAVERTASQPLTVHVVHEEMKNMSDVTIACPGCGQELEVPKELLGQAVECPACQQSIQLPDPAPQPAQSGKKKVVIRKRTSPRRSTGRSGASSSKSPRLSTAQGMAIVLGVIIVGVVGGILSSSDSGSSTAKPQPRTIARQIKPDILSGIQAFLTKHKEYGSPTGTQSVPDWAKGKRQRVQFTTGRNLLFYLKDGVVVTVYEDDSRGDRKKIWNSYSGTAEYMKDVSRKPAGSIPEYTVISAISLLAGGKQADVLIPSLTRQTPRDTRSRIAFAILKKEGLRCLSMFSTREACKAAYSDSFAKQHPDASDDYLGGISMNTGTFED